MASLSHVQLLLNPNYVSNDLLILRHSLPNIGINVGRIAYDITFIIYLQIIAIYIIGIETYRCS